VHRPNLELGSAVRKRCGIPETSVVIGIVARIVREKGYREFFEMALNVSMQNDVRFLIVGDSLPSDRDGIGAQLRQWVKESGIEDRFVFTGRTDSVGDYLKSMDIFVLPSYREGFPRSVLEAMATGLPVVSTNIRGCREAVVAGETGLLAPPRDSDALTRAVRTLIDNREMRLRMGAAGRRRVLEKFDEARMTAIFIRNAIATMAKAGVPVPVSNAGLS
jgi:glycosyltransferase involved in cell wall biosynthesis